MSNFSSDGVRSGWPWSDDRIAPHVDESETLEPRISIVIPSYNQAQYIEETIRSILLQRYPNLELIVVEDCSTDTTELVLEKYADRLRVVRNDRNRGMSHSINKGWKLCSGEIITWISSDDIYCPEAFKRVAAAWKEDPGCGAIVGAFQFMNASSIVTQEIHPPRLPRPAPLDLSITEESWRLHQVATFYTARALDAVGRFVREEIRHNMDREILYRVARQYRIALVQEPLAHFRIHEKSKSWSPSNIIAMAHDHASVQKYFMNDDKAENKIRRRISRIRIANGYVRYSKYSGRIASGLFSLAKAIYYNPSVVVHRDFYIGVLSSLRILPIARRIKSAVTSF